MSDLATADLGSCINDSLLVSGFSVDNFFNVWDALVPIVAEVRAEWEEGIKLVQVFKGEVVDGKPSKEVVGWRLVDGAKKELALVGAPGSLDRGTKGRRTIHGEASNLNGSHSEQAETPPPAPVLDELHSGDMALQSIVNEFNEQSSKLQQQLILCGVLEASVRARINDKKCELENLLLSTGKCQNEIRTMEAVLNESNDSSPRSDLADAYRQFKLSNSATETIRARDRVLAARQRLSTV